MSNATISYGPNLGLLNNAAISEAYYDQLRVFLRGVDSLAQPSIISIISTPPSSPNNGDAYIIDPTSPTGIWSGKGNQLAVYSSQVTAVGSDLLVPGWDYYTPNIGWTVYNLATATNLQFNGTSWIREVPLATTSEVGLVKPDGTTIDVNGSGLISVPTATTSNFGLVKPDGTTVTISDGVITAVTSSGGGGTVTNVALAVPSEFSVSGSPITESGTITISKAAQGANLVYAGPSTGSSTVPSFRALTGTDLPVATVSSFGAIKPDGSTIDIASGLISVPTATTSALGIVKPDNSTITITDGVLSVIGLGPNAGWGSPPGTGSAGSYFVQSMGKADDTSCTFSSPVTVGNTIIVVTANNNVTVSDSLGNTFTQIPYSGNQLYYYISNHITTGGIDTITVSSSSTFNIFEYSGLPTGSGASIVIAGVSTSSTTLGPTTLSSNSLVILFQYSYYPTFPSFLATGATTRFNGVKNTSSYCLDTGDMIVNAGSFSIAIPGATYSGFIAIRTT